tara:strand:+ start:137 stop:1153 length:1017 start_codon:yes stop_codon:yes gene_type:complete
MVKALCAKALLLATHHERPSFCRVVLASTMREASSRAQQQQQQQRFQSGFCDGGRDDDDEKKKSGGLKLVFYRHSLCPYAHRVQLCLDELDALQKTKVVDVDLSNTPEWYLEKTGGRGMVPTMEFFDDDSNPDKSVGELVGESLAINQRLWEQFEGTHDPQTTTDDDVERFTRRCDGAFIGAGLRAIGGGWSFARERNEKTLERLEEEIWELDALIESNNASRATTTNACNDDDIFLFGGRRASLADLAIYPFAERFELALKFFQGYTLGHAEYSAKKGPSGDHREHPIRFQNWLETMRRMPSVQRARVKDEDALLRSWDRTKRLDYFDYETADYEHP